MILLDSSGLFHAAKYTTGHLTYESVTTGVIFGFLRRVLSIGITNNDPQLVFCWDSRRSHRKREYPEYKANRKYEDQTEEEKELNNMAFEQLDRLRTEIIPRLGFSNSFMQNGVEADDIMAKIAFTAPREPGEKPLIVSSDEDMLQCLWAADIYSPSKDIYITEDDFQATYGIESKQWWEVKSIAGCKTDNVKGVVGVGEKTAAKILSGKLKKGKLFDKVWSEEGVAISLRNRPLVELPHRRTRPIRVVKQKPLKKEYYIEICLELGFQSMLNIEIMEKISTCYGWR